METERQYDTKIYMPVYIPTTKSNQIKTPKQKFMEIKRKCKPYIISLHIFMFIILLYVLYNYYTNEKFTTSNNSNSTTVNSSFIHDNTETENFVLPPNLSEDEKIVKQVGFNLIIENFVKELDNITEQNNVTDKADLVKNSIIQPEENKVIEKVIIPLVIDSNNKNSVTKNIMSVTEKTNIVNNSIIQKSEEITNKIINKVITPLVIPNISVILSNIIDLLQKNSEN